jgi:hypothetical protein
VPQGFRTEVVVRGGGSGPPTATTPGGVGTPRHVDEHFARFQVQRMERLRQRDDAAAADLRHGCLLCERGSRTYDKSVQSGSTLFATLAIMVETAVPNHKPLLVAKMGVRFYSDFIVPVFERAGIEPPPFSEAAILEHIVTCTHSINPRLALNVMIRMLMQDLECLQYFKFDDNGVPDGKMLKTQAETMQLLLRLYQMDPAKMVFNEVSDGDLKPAIVASFAPARLGDVERTIAAGDGPREATPLGDIAPTHRDWMLDFLANPAPPAPPAPPVPPAPPAPPGSTMDMLARIDQLTAAGGMLG